MTSGIFNRRQFFTTAAAAGLALRASSVLATEKKTCYFPFQCKPATIIDFGLTPEQEERAKELHSKLYIFDGEPEVDFFEGLYDNILSGGSRGVGGSFTIDAFPFAKIHGLEENLQVTGRDWWVKENIDDNIIFLRQKEQETGQIKICLNSADLKSAAEEGKIAMMLDTQSTYFMGNNLDLLNEYYDKGIRRVQLAYNRASLSATGNADPRDGGLTTFGREVVERMNEVGILVDVGHASPLSMVDAIDASTVPITCSHAGLRSVSPNNPRTHPDDALKKLADSGGVFGVVGSPGTLTPDISDTATVKDFVHSINKAVQFMGVDHVGFANDQVQAPSMKEFLTSPDWPPAAVEAVGVGQWPWSDLFVGMENHSGYPNLTRGLISIGFKDEDIMKVMGGNFIRLVEEVIG